MGAREGQERNLGLNPKELQHLEWKGRNLQKPPRNIRESEISRNQERRVLRRGELNPVRCFDVGRVKDSDHTVSIRVGDVETAGGAPSCHSCVQRLLRTWSPVQMAPEVVQPSTARPVFLVSLPRLPGEPASWTHSLPVKLLLLPSSARTYKFMPLSKRLDVTVPLWPEAG